MCTTYHCKGITRNNQSEGAKAVAIELDLTKQKAWITEDTIQ